MYVPNAFREDDVGRLHGFLRAWSFALLVTDVDGVPVATHLPFVLDEHTSPRGRLIGHVARANPQWRAFDGTRQALVIFSGPHAYVSPTWYATTPAVPTWNYAAVHAYGFPKVLSDPKAKHENQRRLVAAMDPQWLPEFDKLSEKYVTMMLEGIVNFEIAVTRVETRWKLSQNRSRREMELIAVQLDKSGDSLEKALGALTRKHLPKE